MLFVPSPLAATTPTSSLSYSAKEPSDTSSPSATTTPPATNPPASVVSVVPKEAETAGLSDEDEPNQPQYQNAAGPDYQNTVVSASGALVPSSPDRSAVEKEQNTLNANGDTATIYPSIRQQLGSGATVASTANENNNVRSENVNGNEQVTAAKVVTAASGKPIQVGSWRTHCIVLFLLCNQTNLLMSCSLTLCSVPTTVSFVFVAFLQDLLQVFSSG